MKKFLLLLLFVAFGFTSLHAKKGEKQYVIILSMDAFRHDVASLADTPTLDSIKRVGTYSEMVPVFPPNTFPTHYSMATGLFPNNHGIVNNGFYDKELGRDISVFESEDMHTPGMWGGEPIWYTAENQGLTANIFMWVGSEYPIKDHRATVWTKYAKEPDYYERADWVIDAMSGPVDEIPELVMWYFEEPDAVLHSNAPESEQVRDKVEYIDNALGYFFDNIKKSPVYDQINFIFVADHGMTEVSHKRYLNLYPMLDQSKIIRSVRGNPFGLEIEEEYIDEAIEIIEESGLMRAYRREDLPKRLNYGTHPTRISNVLILPNLGWQVDYAPEDRPNPQYKGSHGFDNSYRDMHVVFYASGPMFKKSYRHEELFGNENIYLILCHILGIKPAPNDGDWEAVEPLFVE